MWSNYVYLLLQENADMAFNQSQLDAIAKEENLAEEKTKIQLELLPLNKIVVGEDLLCSEGLHFVGPNISPVVLWFLGGLALVIILSV